MFLPSRDASTVDLISNTAGGALGAAAGSRARTASRVCARASRSGAIVFSSPVAAATSASPCSAYGCSPRSIPASPLFAATFDPSLELTRDLAGTLLQAAQSAFNVIGVGLFLALLLRQRRYFGGAVLVLIGLALMLKGVAAAALLRSTMWENWLKPGTQHRCRGGRASCSC